MGDMATQLDLFEPDARRERCIEEEAPGDIRELQYRYREVVRLAAMGLKYQDIANETGYSRQTVGAILRSDIVKGHLSEVQDTLDDNVPAASRIIDQQMRDALNVQGLMLSGVIPVPELEEGQIALKPGQWMSVVKDSLDRHPDTARVTRTGRDNHTPINIAKLLTERHKKTIDGYTSDAVQRLREEQNRVTVTASSPEDPPPYYPEET